MGVSNPFSFSNIYPHTHTHTHSQPISFLKTQSHWLTTQVADFTPIYIPRHEPTGAEDAIRTTVTKNTISDTNHFL